MLKESLSSRATPKSEYGKGFNRKRKQSTGIGNPDFKGIGANIEHQMTFKHTKVDGEGSASKL